MPFDLAFVWAGIVAFAVLAYVVLDGFDLGVGILFPAGRSDSDRDLMMHSVAPVWDGNETWLVLGGSGLFAAFPLAYSVVLPALYVPILAMLLGLVFRGVAFEYRGRTDRWKRVWDVSFFAGSLTAAVMQGITLGALVQGIEVADRSYAGGWFDWLTPFSILTGAAVAMGYALLGATWLVLKSTGDLQSQMRRLARPLGVVTLGFIGIVSLVTPFLEPAYFKRWFDFPERLFTLLVPILVLITAWMLFRGLKAGRDLQPFLASLALFILSFAGIGISFYPNIVPPDLTIWDAAAPEASLKFTLLGTVVLIPLILAYTGFAYWVFRGKTDPSDGYH